MQESRTFRLTHRLHAGLAPSHYTGTLMKMPFEEMAGARSLLTLALAFLQVVQALGVTESGTFLFLPAVLVEVPCLE